MSDARADAFVAGLSMGGHGALKWALRQPWRFAAAAALPGSLDIARPERGLDATSEFPPGGHEWELWDAQIQRALSWLPLGR